MSARPLAYEEVLNLLEQGNSITVYDGRLFTIRGNGVPKHVVDTLKRRGLIALVGGAYVRVWGNAA